MLIKLWRKLSGRERIESLESNNRCLNYKISTEKRKRFKSAERFENELARIAGDRDEALRAQAAAELEVVRLRGLNKKADSSLMAAEDEKAALIKQIEALKSAAPTIATMDKSSICECGHVIHLNGVGECASHGCECKRKIR